MPIKETVKKRICIMTATRAEYGLLRRLILKLMAQKFDVRVAVTGMHLSEDFGCTVQEIENDGIAIDAKIEILSNTDDAIGVAEAMAAAIVKFAVYFEKTKPQLLIVLGDRYETLGVSIAAMNARIPIAHLHGGEKTEGAMDECLRHAVTKMSYLHFTSCEEYRNRVIQLGEEPERVFNVGGLGVENIFHIKYMEKGEFYQALELGFPLDKPLAIVTFHPVTLEEKTYETQLQEMLLALLDFPDLHYIITKANADEGGRKINHCLEQFVENKSNMCLFDSLGVVRYLSALKYATIVIGNSSSGILEVPSFGIPTINIGDRQKGRIQATSIIDCGTKKEEIVAAIKTGLSQTFREKARKTVNPYGDGNATQKIVSVLEAYMSKEKINLKKNFYDIGGA